MSSIHLANISAIRAFAIVIVVAYHLNFDWAQSGYLGVSLFFCISGFLVSSGFEKASNVSTYLLQRIYRLLPAQVALFTICFVLLNFLPITLIPNIALELKCSAIFIENICLSWNHGYFASDAKFMPVTHLWSLALEVQFYIFLFLIYKFTSKRWKFKIIFTLFCLSILYDVWFSFYHLQESYLSFPSRIWEFFAGCLVSLKQNKLCNSNLFKIYITAIFTILLLYLIQLHITYINYLVGKAITVATGVIVIVFWTNMRYFVIVEFLSRHSYAIYLAHFPAIVTTIFLGGNLFNVHFFIVCFLLFWLIIYFADTSRKTIKSQHLKLAVPSLLVIQFVLAIFGSMAVFKMTSVRDFENLDFKNAAFNHWRYGHCFLDESSRPLKFAHECSSGQSVALLGDSHAAQLLPVLQEMGLEKDEIAQATVGGCLIDIRKESPLTCNNAIADFFASMQPAPINVLLAARFSDIPESELEEKIGSTIRYLKNKGAKNIIILGTLPYFHPTAPFLYWQAGYVQDGFMYVSRNLLVDRMAVNKRVSEKLERVSKENGVRYLDLSELFCDKVRCKVGDKSLEQFYFSDYDHLTLAGASYVGNSLLIKGVTIAKK